MVQPLPLLVLLGELQAFFAPQAFDLLVIDPSLGRRFGKAKSAERGPAFDAKWLSDLSVAVAPILLSQPDYREAQRFIILWCRPVLQSTPRHPYDPTRTPFRGCQLLSGMHHGLTKLKLVCRQAFGSK